MKESLMIAVFIIIVFVVLQYIGKNIVMKKMTTSLEEENMMPFLKQVKVFYVFLFVKPYIKESMKLSAYIAQEESEEVKRNSPYRKYAYKTSTKINEYFKCILFLFRKREEASCKQMLDYVKKLGDERTYNNLKIQYDIFILKRKQTY